MPCKLLDITLKLKCFSSRLFSPNIILSHFKLPFIKSKFASSLRFITLKILYIFPFISTFFASFRCLHVINVILVV